MIELVRIVPYQAVLSSYKATQNEERALQLELLIEHTKPKNLYSAWHPLIAMSFRYGPPLLQGRFRPPYGKNVFYGSRVEETALYEHAYHFMKQRVHLKKLKTETGIRTLFAVGVKDNNAIQIKNYFNSDLIMDKNDYSHSHQFILSHPHVTLITYPSCRDPQKRDNAAVLDIQRLEKKLTWQTSIQFFYDNKAKKISWLDYGVHIRWEQLV